MIDFEKVRQRAAHYEKDIFRFLRDMIAIPSESCGETAVIQRIREEMEHLEFDRIEIDPMGNILGFIGTGRHLIAMDAHVDTVGVGDPSQWTFDPYEGYEDDETIGGRGASDQEGGMASLVYGARIIKDLGLLDDATLMITGSVQEEDCDGLCWQYIIQEDGYRPEFVVSSEPTSCNIYRGHRGRMEIKVTTSGISCHGSAPERGINAIYKMSDILNDLEALNHRLAKDDFLGAGTLTVSEIWSGSPSRCAVADHCGISIDRRLTQGETEVTALGEINRLPSVQKAGANAEMYKYRKPSCTGLIYPTEAYFPTWSIPESHPVTQALVCGYKGLFQREPLVDKWTFSTNGVAVMGRFLIPCIGFGPGHEDQAHAPNEKTWKKELVQAAAMYAVIPKIYLSNKRHSLSDQ